jgi:dTDP-4-amino-4,6-dideoxygalactose transaminase
VAIARPSVGEAEWNALRQPLESGWLTQGPIVGQFERAFAERHGVAHALATTSCSTALHLALVALGIGPGDEVIVPAFTWVATANAVVHCRATPVFVDVDPHTFNVDPEEVASSAGAATRAAIPVHLFGLCADMGAIREAVPDEVYLIEDAACAVGAERAGVRAGGLGDIACFSFHPRKIITTGEGGMLTTNDPHRAEEANRLRNHGASIPEEVRHTSDDPYELPEFDALGFNYRMTDLQAAVGLTQLGRLDDFLAERDVLANSYNDALGDIEWLQLPCVPQGYRHSWQSYVVVIRPESPVGRGELMARLQDRGVSARPGTHAVPALSLYRRMMGTEPEAFPVASMLHQRAMAIPLHNRMTEDDVAYVSTAIRESVR